MTLCVALPVPEQLSGRRLDLVRVDDGDITPDDVRRTGMSLTDLQTSIDGDGPLLRIELGLTESLDVGYRLSPRGQNVLGKL